MSKYDGKLRQRCEGNLSGKPRSNLNARMAISAEKNKIYFVNQGVEKRIDAATAARIDIELFAELIRKYARFNGIGRFMMHELIDNMVIYGMPDIGTVA